MAGFFSNFQENYRGGLAALQEYCTQQMGAKFGELAWDKQTVVLKFVVCVTCQSDRKFNN